MYMAKPVRKNLLEKNVINTNDTYFDLHFIYAIGSGKTYTMVGSNTNPGIIPRVFPYIFEEYKRYPESNFTIEISMIEMYERQKPL